MRLESQSEHAAPGLVQKAHAHVLKSLASEIAKLETAASASLEAGPLIGLIPPQLLCFRGRS